MPSCCRGTICNCLVVAGSGVLIDGSGQPDDPFVVSAPGGGGGGGASPWTVVPADSGYIAVPSDFVAVDATAGGVVITLPGAPPTGTVVGVKKVDASANVVTVSTIDLSTIDGDANATMTAQWGGGVFIFDGANWLVLGGM